MSHIAVGTLYYCKKIEELFTLSPELPLLMDLVF